MIVSSKPDQGSSKFSCNGGHYHSAKGTSFVGTSAGILRQKIFKFGGYEMLFSALVMGYVSEKSTSNKCGKQVFSVLASAYFRGPVNLKYTIYPSTSTPNISQYCMMFGSITFCLYTICTHHGPTNFSGMKMANNCKSLQSK